MRTLADVSEVDDPEREAPPLPRSMWLLSESRRSTVALAIALPLAVGAVMLLTAAFDDLASVLGADATARSLVGAVVAWTLFTVLHTALTWLTYRGLAGEEFRRAVDADPSWRRDRHRAAWVRLLLGIGPASWSVSVSALALFVVLAMLLLPGLRAVPVATVLALAMVAASWLNVAVAYAVHHARSDRECAVFEFPGEPPARFVDYLYLSVAVQATFGATDVQIRTSGGRRQIMTQSVLAFGFNTVIIGMLISLLVGVS